MVTTSTESYVHTQTHGSYHHSVGLYVWSQATNALQKGYSEQLHKQASKDDSCDDVHERYDVELRIGPTLRLVFCKSVCIVYFRVLTLLSTP